MYLGQHQRKEPSVHPDHTPAHLQKARHSHLTAWRTRLSSGLRLGSLVEERMPVPQLLASVFLGEGHRRMESPPVMVGA